MKPIQSLFQLLLIAALLAGCSPRPATETATAQPATLAPTLTAPPPTQTPAPTQTVTPQPTNTRVPPTPIPTMEVAPVQPVTGLPKGTDNNPWWNDAVFYEIFVRSFQDSDGDGKGDFNGLISRLDYLNDCDPNTTTDLGVTALWLMPIQPSPSYHGYDVTDYYDINPDYGTLDDFKRFLDEAHKRGIRVIIDWVLNHTSNKHAWFEQAQDPQSPYRKWYRWTADRPTTPGWHPGGGGEYYYALFSIGMPDLNYQNPEVIAEMKKVMRFWLKEVGVDGFRLDAAKHLIEDGGVIENTPETHAVYKELRKYYKSINPQAMTVGEVWSPSETVRTYLNGDELDLAFDFDLGKNLLFSAGTYSPKYAADAFNHDVPIFLPGQFATFITNHDQDRGMSTLNDDVEAAKNTAMLLLTAPGVPFLYYGEEIGMLGKKPDEDIRLPMQWTGEANAGFTSGTPWRKPKPDFNTKNIATQSADPSSLLSLYRTLIHLRNNHAALRVGEYFGVMTGSQAVFASLRASKEENVLVLINMSDAPVRDYALRMDSGPLSGEYTATALLGGGIMTPPQINAQGGFDDYQPLPEIPPFGRLIIQIQEK